MDTLLLYSKHTDPYINLAIEECLLENIGDACRHVMLWQNKNAVVFGRNQNPWRECALDAMRADGVAPVRRITGGGAVYHDKGNLNFSFISSNGCFDTGDDFELIAGVLRDLGIEAEISGRNDMTLYGRKFSGSAFAKRKNASLHHGTLLVDTDTSRLGRYLTPSAAKLAAKGVASVKSRVINLSEVQPALTAGILREAIFDGIRKRTGAAGQVDADEIADRNKVAVLRERNASWEYIMGATPDFSTELSARFVWGEITLMLNVSHGIITNAALYSDALETELIAGAGTLLVGVHYTRAEVYKALAALAQNEAEHAIARDISSVVDA